MKVIKNDKIMKLVSCSYRIEFEDHFYTVKYKYEAGWYVDGVYVTPMVEGLGTKMYEMAVNVLQVWLNANHIANGKKD